jgi:hypothetical protein
MQAACAAPAASLCGSPRWRLTPHTSPLCRGDARPRTTSTRCHAAGPHVLAGHLDVTARSHEDHDLRPAADCACRLPYPLEGSFPNSCAQSTRSSRDRTGSSAATHPAFPAGRGCRRGGRDRVSAREDPLATFRRPLGLESRLVASYSSGLLATSPEPRLPERRRGAPTPGITGRSPLWTDGQSERAGATLHSDDDARMNGSSEGDAARTPSLQRGFVAACACSAASRGPCFRRGCPTPRSVCMSQGVGVIRRCWPESSPGPYRR